MCDLSVKTSVATVIHLSRLLEGQEAALATRPPRSALPDLVVCTAPPKPIGVTPMFGSTDV